MCIFWLDFMSCSICKWTHTSMLYLKLHWLNCWSLGGSRTTDISPSYKVILNVFGHSHLPTHTVDTEQHKSSFFKDMFLYPSHLSHIFRHSGLVCYNQTLLTVTKARWPKTGKQRLNTRRHMEDHRGEETPGLLLCSNPSGDLPASASTLWPETLKAISFQCAHVWLRLLEDHRHHRKKTGGVPQQVPQAFPQDLLAKHHLKWGS